MPQDVLYLFLLNVLMWCYENVNTSGKFIYFHGMVNCSSIFHKTLIGTFFFFNMVTLPQTVQTPRSHITILAMMRFWEFYQRHLMNTWNKHTSMPTTFCKRRQRQKGEGIRHPLPMVSTCILCHIPHLSLYTPIPSSGRMSLNSHIPFSQQDLSS